MSAVFFKKSVFLAKIAPLHKAIVWKLWLRIFSSVFSFAKIKGYYYLKFKFCWLRVQNPASGFLQLVVNWKNCCDVTNSWHDIIVKFFCCCFVSLVKFSYWSKFHVNIITGSGVMTIFFYMGLTKNPKIGNTPVWVLPNICRLDTKFGTNVPNKMLLNSTKCEGYSFYRFWVIKRKPTAV